MNNETMISRFFMRVSYFMESVSLILNGWRKNETPDGQRWTKTEHVGGASYSMTYGRQSALAEIQRSQKE